MILLHGGFVPATWAAGPGSGPETLPATSPNPRQQTNELTAFLDGSVIYGSDPVRAAALRAFHGGLLRTSQGDMPPLNTDGLPNANDAHIVPDGQLFLAGDVRANENIELTSVHALFVREHNRIAGELARRNPRLSDEEIYQQARHLVGAVLQVITYKEWLPALLGPDAIRPYSGYHPFVNPGISNEFSTAAFRVGHTLINDDVEFLDNDGNPVRDELALREAFFNPAALIEVGPDPILKYLATDNAQEVDLKLVDGLRNFLFGPPGAGGFDLAARNIQRGRDHGLADYNTTRRAYGLRPVTRFSDITGNVGLQDQIRSLYGDVNRIDLWVGGLAEDHAPNASVGPTFRRIIADQFTRLRDGDRFWYQRQYSGSTLAALESVRLSDVIRRNTTITSLQDNVFFFQPGVSVATGGDRTPPDYLGAPSRLRTIDGSRNNPYRAQWGMTGIMLLRLAPAAYADGLSAPAGPNRPGARLISNTLCAQSEAESGEDAPRNNRFLSDWMYAWGQFIDHDLDLTTTGSTAFDIPVPAGDAFFDPDGTGIQVIPLVRSNFDPRTGGGSDGGPRSTLIEFSLFE